MARTLIRGATVLTLDPALGDFQRADMLIDDSAIAEVAPTISADDAEVVEATGQVRVGRVGGAEIRLMSQRALVAFAVPWFETTLGGT